MKWISLVRKQKVLFVNKRIRRRYATISDSIHKDLVCVQDIPFKDTLKYQDQIILQWNHQLPIQLHIHPVIDAKDYKLQVFNPSIQITSIDKEDEQSWFDIQMESTKKNERIHRVSSHQLEPEGDLDSESIHAFLIAKLYVPYQLHLRISIPRGDIFLYDKIEGNSKIVLGKGNIQIDKLRGETISLVSNNGTIQINSLLEAQHLQLEASIIHCKKLMASLADIKLLKCPESTVTNEFNAIYAKICSIYVLSSTVLQCGAIHGHLSIAGSKVREIDIESMNGSLDIDDQGGDCHVKAHLDTWSVNDTTNIFVGGDVQFTMNPTDNTSLNMELHAKNISLGDKCLLKNEEKELLGSDYTMISGTLDTISLKTNGTRSGKINNTIGKHSAMTTSFYSANQEMKENNMTLVTEKRELNPDTSCLRIHSLQGSIKIDQLNWMERIRLKHLKK